MTDAKKTPFQWGFKSAAATIAVIALWAELFVWLLAATRVADGPAAFAYGAGFFLCILPLIAAAIYAWPLVFGFFRSVKVGITNLIFIGLASIAGVLFIQEDPNGPIAPESAVGDLVEVSPARLANFDQFRQAHSHFTYKLLHGTSGWLYHALPGTASECLVKARAAGDEAKLAHLAAEMKQIQVEERFGEEYAVALEAKSETGLRTQAENAEIRRLEDDWKDAWWTLFHYADTLDLLRVYKSDWFASFWFILLGGVISNTFRGGWRRLLRPRKWGFLITHTGVVLLVLGGFWGRVTEQRGILNLNIGRASDRFVTYAREINPFQPKTLFDRDTGLPFQVRLDAFRADYHDILSVVYAIRTPEGGLDFEYQHLEPPKFRVYQGQKLYFDYGPGDAAFLGESRDPSKVPHLRVEVLEYLPQADLQPRLVPSEPGSPFGQPLMAVSLLAPGGRTELEQILTGPESAPLAHAGSGSRLRMQAVASEDQARASLAQAVELLRGHLVQHDAGHQNILAREGINPGSALSLEAAGRRYQLEVLEALPMPRLQPSEDGSWKLVPSEVPVENQAALNPAALVRITDDAGEQEERWVFQSGFLDLGSRFTELNLAFEWDVWASPATARYRLFLLSNGEQTRLLAGVAGDPGSLQEIGLGQPLPLEGGYQLVIDAAEVSGTRETEIAPVEGADFFHPAPGAVRVRVTTPEGQREFVMSTDVDGHWVEYAGPGGQPRLLKLMFTEDTNDMPLEWQSKLSFFRGKTGEDGSVHHHGLAEDSGHIRVNDYEVFEGYRFFQTNWDKGDPTYSGIGIVYDPGIEIVLLGFYMVAFGTITVFLINPFVTKRHRGI